MTTDLRNLIDRALNPRVHGADSDHCPACFGACASFPGEWTEDAEELAADLAKALEALLDKIKDATRIADIVLAYSYYEGREELVVTAEDRDGHGYNYALHSATAVRAYLLGEEGPPVSEFKPSHRVRERGADAWTDVRADGTEPQTYYDRDSKTIYAGIWFRHMEIERLGEETRA